MNALRKQVSRMNKYIIVAIVLFDFICLLPFVEMKLRNRKPTPYKPKGE